MRVLIVDDSNAVSMMAKEMLKALGHEAERLKDAAECEEHLKKEKYDLILLDWNMPKMQGIDFLELNQEKNITDAKIMMMTTENKPEFIVRALSTGACEYIMKPFTQDVLQSKIGQVFKGAA